MTTLRTRAVILALAASAAAPAGARAAGLKHLLTITADEKGEPLRAPEGSACTDQGALVVADTGNGRLLTFTYRDGRLAPGAVVRLAEAASPSRVQIDGQGNVLVLDRRSKRIVRVDAAGRYAGAVELKGAAGRAAPVPTAFKVDAAGTLYVLDVAGRRVLVAAADGTVGRELPWPAGPEEFTDLAVDAGGRILAVDSVGSRVWAAEKADTAFKAIGEGLKDRVSFPAGLTEHRGRLYLVDQHGHGLALLAGDGSFQGRELEMGWVDGKLYYPAQLCANGEGQLFIADRGNNRVQVFGESR